ncbi:hypothetical protein NSTCB13_06490 [Nostoc sp. DSM 114160]|jgi:hypothetical protein
MAERFESAITTELQNLKTAQNLLPIWNIQWGVEDLGLSIHSLGMTYLALLGNHLGYVGVAEVQALQKGQYAYIGDDVRSDAVWFDQTTHSPFLIAEFERYSSVEDQSKLEGKVKNLLLAQHRWQETAELLLLAYWTKRLISPPEHSNFQQIINRGFETQAKERVKGSSRGQLLVLEFAMRKNINPSIYHLSEIILREN